MKKIYALLIAAILLHGCTSDGSLSYNPFDYGVASGDPSHNSIVIWSKINPPSQNADSVAIVQVAQDTTFTSIIRQDTILLDSSTDYTLKRVIFDLDPGKPYYYRFGYMGQYSPIGIAKTTPKIADTIRLAAVSCSNYEAGYFNVYRHLASRTDLNAVLHLGDYLYEYAPGVYGDTTLQRLHKPAKEMITLEDYRIRYAQYRSDPDLQLAHQNQTFITIWDDHETANNSYATGAQNHQAEEGSYDERKAASIKAYQEWMPITEGDIHYRSIPFGKMAHLLMVDGRLEGRTEQLYDADSAALYAQDRSMLGENQLNWLLDELKNSSSYWNIIGNPVLFSYHENVHYSPDNPRNRDAWDGYPAEKEKILNFIEDKKVSNVVFVSGDTHMSWAFEVLNDMPEKIAYQNGEEVVHAVEFGVPSITSKSSGEYYDTKEEMLEQEQKLLQPEFNPHLKYANLLEHGYVLLEITKNEVIASFIYVPTVKKPTDEMVAYKKIRVKNGTNTLEVL